MKETDPNFGCTRKVWLHMLEQGGRWTSTELAKELSMEAKVVDRLIYHMLRAKSLTRYPHPRRKNGVAFGVVSGNTVPRSVNLQDVLTATGIRLWEA